MEGDEDEGVSFGVGDARGIVEISRSSPRRGGEVAELGVDGG